MHWLHNLISGKSRYAAALTVILLISLASYGYGTGWVDSSRTLSDAEAAVLAGGMDWGGCGILAGIAIGVFALGSSTVTVGMGAALAISVGAHVAAAICVS